MRLIEKALFQQQQEEPAVESTAFIKILKVFDDFLLGIGFIASILIRSFIIIISIYDGVSTTNKDK